MMSLSLSWTYQRDRVSLLVKFELKKIILFKYCVDVENCEGFRSFNYIYIYIDQSLTCAMLGKVLQNTKIFQLRSGQLSEKMNVTINVFGGLREIQLR